MRNLLASIAVILVVAASGGLVFVYSGAYSVAADDPHWPVTQWILDTVRMHSIEAHAAGIEVPGGLDEYAKLVMGTEHFAAHCSVCHGAPGVPNGEIAHGLNPQPPDLTHASGHYTPSELFWILKHGIKMTGMPSWGRHSDEGAMGDGWLPREAAGHERAGLRQSGKGEHGARRSSLTARP